MRHRTILIIYVVSVVAALGSGYFLGKNGRRGSTSSTLSAVKADTASPTATKPDKSLDTTTPAESAPVPSQGQTYIVKKGDTLFSIGQHYKVSWPALAKVNDLQETSVLKEGQVLKIPTEHEAQTVQSQSLKISADAEEKQTLQAAQDYAKAGTGQLAYRLVPTQVVLQSTQISRFQFGPNDLYVEKSKDIEKGEAVVEVTHNGKLYTVRLSQPLEKGDKGVWTITEVNY